MKKENERRIMKKNGKKMITKKEKKSTEPVLNVISHTFIRPVATKTYIYSHTQIQLNTASQHHQQDCFLQQYMCVY